MIKNFIGGGGGGAGGWDVEGENERCLKRAGGGDQGMFPKTA